MRQRPVQDAVAPLLRTMARGPDPAWERRAVAASFMLMVVDESLDSMGGGFVHFHGPSWYDRNVKPYWASI
jgi:hypothetical protein